MHHSTDLPAVQVDRLDRRLRPQVEAERAVLLRGAGDQLVRFAAVAVHAGSVTARPDRLDAVRRYRREAVVTGTGPAAWTADAGPPPPVRTRTPAVVPA